MRSRSTFTLLRVLFVLLLVGGWFVAPRLAERMMQLDVERRAGLDPFPPHQAQPHEVALTGSTDRHPWLVSTYTGEVYVRRTDGPDGWTRQEVGEVVAASSGTVFDIDRDGRRELLIPTTDALVTLGPGVRMVISSDLADCAELVALVDDGVPTLACREGAGWKLAAWGRSGPEDPVPADERMTRLLRVPNAVGRADLDDDGTSDVVSHTSAGRLELRLSGSPNATRTIAFAALPAPAANGVVSLQSTIADVDGNGVDDLVLHGQDLTGRHDIGGTWVLLGRRDGTPRPPHRFDSSSLSPGQAPLVDDLDRDGRDEVVLIGSDPATPRTRFRTVRVYRLARNGDWVRIADYALPRGIASSAAVGQLRDGGERGVVVSIFDAHREDGRMQLDGGLAILTLDELRGDRPGPG